MKKLYNKIVWGLLPLLLLLSGQVSGQILTFDFAGLLGGEASANSNFNNANLAISTISRGAGLTASANADRFNATNWALTSTSNAISGNNYMEFSINPNVSYQFSVTSIVINLQRSGTGPSAVALRSSANTYTTNLDVEKSITDNTTTQTFTFTFTQSNISSAVTYRFYMFAEATAGSGGIGDGAGNDITVNGTVASTATPTIALSSPSQITAGNIAQCNTNNILSAFQSAVTVASATLNSVQITTAGTYSASSHFSNFKLLYNSTNTFGTAIQIGTTQASVATGNTITFSGLTQSIANGNTGYFWIVADANATATATQTISIASNPTLTFASGTPTGTINVGGTQTITSSSITEATSVSATAGTGQVTIGWTNPTCAQEIMIVAKQGTFTATLPTGDGTAYTANLAYTSGTGFDGGFVVYKGSASSQIITGLTNCLAYEFKIFARKGTTWSTGVTITGLPSSATSTATDVVFVASSEAVTISALENTATISNAAQGTQVLRLTIRDGGAGLNDADCLPTIVNSIVLTPNAGDAIGTWSDAIQSIAIFDGATLLANGVVAANITFTGAPLISIADGTQKTLTIRLSLKNPLPAAAIDGDDFVFTLTSANFTTATAATSSQKNITTQNSTNGQNAISVIATELRYVSQAVNTSINVPMTSPTVQATDINGNRDLGFNSLVSTTSTGTLNSTPKTATAISGLATFNTIIHTASGTGFALTATSAGLVTVVSNTFDITLITTLYPGDIAMVAFNTNDFGCSSNDSDFITFICFKDITTNTSIDITDNGWQRANTGQWGDTEGALRCVYTGSASIVAGTKITFILPVTGLPVVTNWTFADLGSGATVNLNSAGDQLYFMQGGTWTNPVGAHNVTYSGGRVLYAFNTTLNWNAFVDNSSNSGLYPNMRCFSTSITSGNYVRYLSTATEATQRDWIDRLNSATNWTSYANCAGYNGSSSPAFSILAGGAIAGRWLGGTSTNWFDCENWDNLAVPESTTDVTISTTATNNPTISATATYSDDFSDIAECNNIDVSKLNLTLESNNNNRIDVYGNLTVSGTGGIDMNDSDNTTADGQIRLKGNFINQVSAGLDEGNSTFLFNGTTEQTIENTAAANEGFFNITIDKVAGDLKLLDNITLGTSTLANTLTLTSGDVNTNGFNIDMGTTATLSETLQNHLIKDLAATTEANKGGYIRFTNRNVNATQTSIGGSRLLLNRTAGADYTVNIDRYHYRGDYGKAIRLIYAVAVNTGTMGATNLRINYADDEAFGMIEPLDVSRWTAATGWANYTADAKSATLNFGQRNGITAFSHWTLSDTNVPLYPIALQARQTGEQASALSWQASLPTGMYILQKSTDGLSFQNLTTTEKQTYTDSEFQASAYYRLQYTQNNALAYSPTVFLKYEAGSSVLFYPNPFTANDDIHFILPAQTEVRNIYITDAQGKTVAQTTRANLTALLHNLPKGMYILQIQTNKNVEHLKVVKQ